MKNQITIWVLVVLIMGIIKRILFIICFSFLINSCRPPELEGAFVPATQNQNYNPFPNANTFYAAQGGIADIKKFNEGGVQYLPSKIVKDEKDYSLYERAGGYIEDETGMGNKDKDTMLAQLADGEFVSRADAILGAGIMSGASPSDFKDMRAKGAKFFYNQQSQLKRIYELTDGAKQIKN